MGFDDEFLDLKHAIRTYGPIMVHGRYVRKREDALDRGDQDEADHWEVRRQSVGMYIDRRRFRYNVFSFSVGAVLALLPTGYVWIELQELVYTIPTFLIFTFILYLAVRFVTNFVAWAAGAFLWVAFGSLGWQVYTWLREAHWPGLSVGDAFIWIGLRPSFVAIEGWVGVSEIVNAAYKWIFDLSLPVGCLILAMIFGMILLSMENLDIPKAEESDWSG